MINSKNFFIKNYIFQDSENFKVFVRKNCKIFLISFNQSKKNKIKKNTIGFIRFFKIINLFDILEKNQFLIIFCKKKKKLFPIILSKNFLRKKCEKKNIIYKKKKTKSIVKKKGLRIFSNIIFKKRNRKQKF
jgi:hypothetical protein